MKRVPLILFVTALVFCFACVKPKTKNPVPVISFEEMSSVGKSAGTLRDTAVFKIHFEDGDGDLFVDNSTQGPTVVLTPFYIDPALKTLTVQMDPYTHDTLRISYNIQQPDNGYYKGKSVSGDILIPLNEFRPNDSVKVVKFRGFVEDVKGHKSNVITTPQITVNNTLVPVR